MYPTMCLAWRDLRRGAAAVRLCRAGHALRRLFAALELWVGHVWWPVHLWAGAVVLAGVTGLLLSSITLPSRVAKRVVL